MGLARFDAGSVGFALTTALTITVYTLIDGRGAFGHDGDTDCGSSPRCAERACSVRRFLAWPLDELPLPARLVATLFVLAVIALMRLN